MLRSLKQLYGAKLGASDGEIGSVKDFYFDDQDWTIRYVVADTGSWLADRQVLLSHHCLGRLEQPRKILQVKLTRTQIEKSPPIETHKPVSRQHEADYHRYYNWPHYWQPEATPAAPQDAQPHLRSAKAVTGYQLHTEGGILGHICDFMIDIETWAIQQIVVRTGNRFSGEEVMIQIKSVQRINHSDSTVFVQLAGEGVKQIPTPPTPALLPHGHSP